MFAAFVKFPVGEIFCDLFNIYFCIADNYNLHKSIINYIYIPKQCFKLEIR